MWSKWTERWEKTLEAVQNLNGDVRELKICKPALENEVEEVEKKLGFKLPKSFRKVLLEFSANVNFEWYLPDNIELPHELREIFSGECSWNIDWICELEETRKDWIVHCFSDTNDDYDKIWHNKLAFMNVPNGDMIAIDLKEYPERTPVVYLSHDDGEGHGYILGEDFIDFIDKWTLLGCPGSEYWQIVPFIATETSGIDPNCENAIRWRNVLGIRFE